MAYINLTSCGTGALGWSNRSQNWFLLHQDISTFGVLGHHRSGQVPGRVLDWQKLPQSYLDGHHGVCRGDYRIDCHLDLPMPTTASSTSGNTREPVLSGLGQPELGCIQCVLGGYGLAPIRSTYLACLQVTIGEEGKISSLDESVCGKCVC